MFFLILLSLMLIYFGFLLFQKQTLKLFSIFIAPLVRLYVEKRIICGLEDPKRKTERFAIPSIVRPEGKVVWIHAVSVGETLSVIPFIEMFKEINSEVSILLTTTTLAASKIIEERLSGKVIHQFCPFDVFKWIRRFIKYWKPSAVFFVESELWPNTLYYLREKDIKTYLLNVRVSKRSLKRFQIAKKYFNFVPFSLFTTIFAPTKELKNYLIDLSAIDVAILPNMKTISNKLPFSFDNSEKIQKRINNRKVWMAVSSHPGEEDLIIQTHKILKQNYPELLTVIAIRHPNRSAELINLIKIQEYTCVSYSENFELETEVTQDFYIIDKIGVLGDFFDKIKTVLVCGSLVDGIGGHNFLEPLNFKCNVATGQYIENFRDIYPYVEKYCKKVHNVNELVAFVTESLNNDLEIEIDKIDFKNIWKNAIIGISKAIS